MRAFAKRQHPLLYEAEYMAAFHEARVPVEAQTLPAEGSHCFEPCCKGPDCESLGAGVVNYQAGEVHQVYPPAKVEERGRRPLGGTAGQGPVEVSRGAKAHIRGRGPWAGQRPIGGGRPIGVGHGASQRRRDGRGCLFRDKDAVVVTSRCRCCEPVLRPKTVMLRSKKLTRHG